MSDWCELGTATLDPASKALFVQCKGAPVDADGTAPDYGKAPMMCALGLTALPFPATENGAAEGLSDTSIPGLDGAIIAARDARTASVVGKGEPGDTILHATNPDPVAQIQLKGVKRQVAALSRDSKGKTQLFLLDGMNDKAQLAVSGALIEIDEKGQIHLTSKDGCGLIIGKSVQIVGPFNINTPIPGFAIAMMPSVPTIIPTPAPGAPLPFKAMPNSGGGA